MMTLRNRFKVRSHALLTKSRLLLCFLLILGAPAITRAEPASIEGATLILPEVVVEDAKFYVELTIIEGTDPPQLELTAFDILFGPAAADASFFIDGILTVPSVAFGGTPLWAQFSLIDDDPIIFQLLAANIDDLDDDDDGIPDTEDAFPYTPAEELFVLPVVTVGSSSFLLEFAVTGGGGPEELVLVNFEILTNPDTTNASFFDGGILTIPSINIGGILYWRQYEFVSADPYTFRQTAEGIDDFDDDDDGIPDTQDDEPYSAAVNNPNDPANLVGFWNFTFQIDPASQVQNTACAEDAIVENDTFEIIYSAFTGYAIKTGLAELPLTVSVNRIFWAGVYPEDGGTTTSAVNMNILSATSLAGDETWTWRATDAVPCVDIHSTVTAQRQ